jgi:GDPmannose 4,6-dehydratase
MWLILQEEHPDDFVCATGKARSVQELVEYVFGSLGLDWEKFVEVDKRLLRPEEVRGLRGDSTKLRSKVGWEPEYTFESMLDEMIEYWQRQLRDPAPMGAAI